MMTVTLENRGLNLSNVLCSKTTHSKVPMAMGALVYFTILHEKT